MNLEEARRKLIITPEEEKSVGDYINHFHTQINVLASFDVLKYLELYRKGWGLAGAEIVKDSGDNNAEELGKIILERIDDLANVYSVMCKYSRTARCHSYLYRGTSNNEARGLKTEDSYDRIVSTTTRLDVAKTFTEYNNAAILRIHVGDDIPFLDVDDFIGVENLNREENEIILSPFSKLNKSEYSYEDKGYSYYNVGLEKPELRQFQEGEKEQFRERIKKEFSKILELGGEYSRLDDEGEINFYRLQRAQNSEDVKYLREKMDENFNEKSKIRPILNEFSEIMKNYIQGLCLERQREFEEASKIVEKDNRRRIAEKIAKRQEEQRMQEISDCNSQIAYSNESLSYIPSNIEFNYNDLKLRSENFSKMCSNLGIPFNSEIDTKTIESYINKIKENMNNIRVNSDLDPITEDASLDYVYKIKDGINNTYTVLINASSISNNLSNTVQMYNQQALEDIKRNIDFKIQEMMRKAKVEQLENRKTEIANKKVSFLGQLTGQKKLKEIELKNLELQIEFEKTKPVTAKNRYSIHDSLSDMIVFSNESLNGSMTPEMQDFYYNLLSNFGINKDYLDRLVYEKLMAKPAMINPSDKMHTSERIARLNEDNIYLQQGIQNNNYQNSNLGFQQYTNITNHGVAQFIRILDDVSKATEVEGQENALLNNNVRQDGKDDNSTR